MTGAGMLDCKKALEETDGDMEEAAKLLRVKGLAGAAKRDDREASEGAVAAVRSGDAAAIVELRCETDFVAKADEFVALADELAALVAAKGEDAAGELHDEIDRPAHHAQGEHLGRAGAPARGRARPGGRHLPAPAGRPRRQRGGRGASRAAPRSSPTTSPCTSPSPSRPT